MKTKFQNSIPFSRYSRKTVYQLIHFFDLQMVPSTTLTTHCRGRWVLSMA